MGFQSMATCSPWLMELVVTKAYLAFVPFMYFAPFQNHAAI